MRKIFNYSLMSVVFVLCPITGCVTDQVLTSNNQTFTHIALGTGNISYANTTTDKLSFSYKYKEIPSSNTIKLSVDTHQMTNDSGSLSNFLHYSKIHSHSLPGTSYSQAQVLASVDGDGTLVADTYYGDLRTNQNAKLYFLSTQSKTVSMIGQLSKGGGVISSAVLSRNWIAWTDFLPNGMMLNIGVLDRINGHLWYVGSIKDEGDFIKKDLTDQLFIRGDLLIAYSHNRVYSYNMATRKWSILYALSPDSKSQINGLQLAPNGEVVQLAQANVLGESMVIWLDKDWTKVLGTYDLPKDVLYMTGSSGNKIIFDGMSGSTYLWSLGSHTVQKISDVSSWLSGAENRYLAGWGYSSKSAGQLLDMQTKRHYNFNANSAIVTSTRLYWTKRNVMYWSILPN
jgi:hypothetical protein